MVKMDLLINQVNEKNELSELEKANRRIEQLEIDKEEYRKKYELIKKVEEKGGGDEYIA